MTPAPRFIMIPVARTSLRSAGVTGRRAWAGSSRQLELTTGSPDWSSWLRRAARADLASGIPERREPGFWDNVARCCGSAGVAEFFLDLNRVEDRPEYLAFARTLADDLLERAIIDPAGMRWSNYEFRLPDRTCRRRRPTCREPLALARRCCACIVTWRATRGSCAGRTRPPGREQRTPGSDAGNAAGQWRYAR
jgi:hypothetical protein